MQDCKELRGAQKRQCKRECRQDRRLGRADCRIFRQAETINCRDENPQCMELKVERVGLIVEAAGASDAYVSCLRENAKMETEDPELQEDIEDAQASAEGEK